MTSRLASRLRELSRGDRPQGVDRLAIGDGLEGANRAIVDHTPAIDAPPHRVGHWLADAAAGALGGEVLATPLGPCVLVERRYAADHVHGLVPLAPCAGDLDPACAGFALLAGAAHTVDQGGATPHAQRPLLFLDLETTGLAGGAGTHAFLVGCAWFDGHVFRVQQFFMVGHALERALLGAVRQRLEAGGSLVTYNGRTFDVPLLETRYLFHRQPLPFAARPHLDMLPVARRLWRYARPTVDVPGLQTDSCTLGALERVLFGVQRTGDVPGFEIPGRYFSFLRSGDASPLEPVLEHNRLDLVSLAVLTARALRLLDDAPHGANRPRECLGLGRMFERVGLLERAEDCYTRAISLTDGSWHDDDAMVAAEALRALALRCRRAGRYAEASAHWEGLSRLSRCPVGYRREALEALAIHHEHRSRDLERARLFAEQSERLSRARGEQEDAERRLARLRRKQARSSAGGGSQTLWN